VAHQPHQVLDGPAGRGRVHGLGADVRVVRRPAQQEDQAADLLDRPLPCGGPDRLVHAVGAVSRPAQQLHEP
jgi:hypothetical protein